MEIFAKIHKQCLLSNIVKLPGSGKIVRVDELNSFRNDCGGSMRKLGIAMYFNYLSVILTIGIVSCGVLYSGVKGVVASPKKLAPEWAISEWFNTDRITLKEMREKVVVIGFFQLWCSGCNRFSIPLMEKWEQKYRRRKDFQLIGIHTVFEGHPHQTPKRLRQYIKEKNITYPIGIDDYISNERTPETMIRYRTQGTPEMVIIDKMGRIRFQHFGGFNPADVEKLIDTLLEEDSSDVTEKLE